MALSSTPFHGKLCRIRKNGVNVAFSSDWNITANVATTQITAQGDSWDTHLAGIANWSGSMTLEYAPGNTEQAALANNICTATPGTKLTDVVFVQDVQANQFTGNLFITSMAVKAALGDKVTVSFNFTGDGALSQVSNGS